jgi:hypothetical protein
VRGDERVALGASGYVPTMVPSLTRSVAPAVSVKLPLSRKRECDSLVHGHEARESAHAVE